jgi:hypothetical protein
MEKKWTKEAGSSEHRKLIVTILSRGEYYWDIIRERFNIILMKIARQFPSAGSGFI